MCRPFVLVPAGCRRSRGAFPDVLLSPGRAFPGGAVVAGHEVLDFGELVFYGGIFGVIPHVLPFYAEAEDGGDPAVVPAAVARTNTLPYAFPLLRHLKWYKF